MVTARPAGVSPSLGGGAPGAGRRPPSPGRSCTLTVVTTYDDDGAGQRRARGDDGRFVTLPPDSGQRDGVIL